jgi:hypothetical protein
MGQLHCYFDDLFQNSIGRPIFPVGISTARKFQ